MNKSELIHAIETKTDFTKKDSEKALNAIVEVLTETLSTGEKFRLWALALSRFAIVLLVWHAILAPASRLKLPQQRLPCLRLARR